MELYIIAGPNGAGKTTFAHRFLPNYADCKNFVNADMIAQGVSPFSPESAALRAGRMMIAEIRTFAKKRVSFGFETTAFRPKLYSLAAAIESARLRIASLLFVVAERGSCCVASQGTRRERRTRHPGNRHPSAIRAINRKFHPSLPPIARLVDAF